MKGSDNIIWTNCTRQYTTFFKSLNIVADKVTAFWNLINVILSTIFVTLCHIHDIQPHSSYLTFNLTYIPDINLFIKLKHTWHTTYLTIPDINLFIKLKHTWHTTYSYIPDINLYIELNIPDIQPSVRQQSGSPRRRCRQRDP